MFAAIKIRHRFRLYRSPTLEIAEFPHFPSSVAMTGSHAREVANDDLSDIYRLFFSTILVWYCQHSLRRLSRGFSGFALGGMFAALLCVLTPALFWLKSIHPPDYAHHSWCYSIRIILTRLITCRCPIGAEPDKTAVILSAFCLVLPESLLSPRYSCIRALLGTSDVSTPLDSAFTSIRQFQNCLLQVWCFL